MHVYFVRHGETDANKRRIYQSPGTPLNEAGRAQARLVGETLRKAKPTMLIGSTYERALQTARIISQATGLTLVPNALVREIEYPSRVMGRPLINLDALIFVCYSVCFRNAPQRRYRDAENLSDMYARIKKTYTLIESLTEAHDAVVVVSHSVYIHLMVAYMCRNRALSVRELIAIYLNFRTFKNCEVIHVEYVGPTPKGACPWLLH